MLAANDNRLAIDVFCVAKRNLVGVQKLEGMLQNGECELGMLRRYYIILNLQQATQGHAQNIGRGVLKAQIACRGTGDRPTPRRRAMAAGVWWHLTVLYANLAHSGIDVLSETSIPDWLQLEYIRQLTNYELQKLVNKYKTAHIVNDKINAPSDESEQMATSPEIFSAFALKE